MFHQSILKLHFYVLLLIIYSFNWTTSEELFFHFFYLFSNSAVYCGMRLVKTKFSSETDRGNKRPSAKMRKDEEISKFNIWKKLEDFRREMGSFLLYVSKFLESWRQIVKKRTTQWVNFVSVRDRKQLRLNCKIIVTRNSKTRK